MLPESMGTCGLYSNLPRQPRTHSRSTLLDQVYIPEDEGAAARDKRHFQRGYKERRIQS